jgi:hypothetical protein
MLKAPVLNAGGGRAPPFSVSARPRKSPCGIQRPPRRNPNIKAVLSQAETPEKPNRISEKALGAPQNPATSDVPARYHGGAASISADAGLPRFPCQPPPARRMWFDDD